MPNHPFRSYINGLSIKKEKLNSEVKYPVPPTTPNLASHVVWKHDKDWKLPKYSVNNTKNNTVEVSLDPKNMFHYVKDHIIDGKVLFPAAGYAFLAWVAFARMKSTTIDMTPVTIRNMKIQRATIVTKTGKFLVNISDSQAMFFCHQF